MRIGVLDIICGAKPSSLHRFDGWERIGRSLNVEFAYINVTGETFEVGSNETKTKIPFVGTEDLLDARKQTLKLLEDCDAFVTDGSVFVYLPETLLRLQERIRQGARVFFTGRSAGDDMQKLAERFLIPYDMVPLGISIQGIIAKQMVRFSRIDDCLRDSRLFGGVDDVYALAPHAIWCVDTALPVLVAGNEHWAYDSRSDYPVDWEAYFRVFKGISERDLHRGELPEGHVTRDLACMGVWYQDGTPEGGAVLASCGCGFFFDPWQQKSVSVLGIESNEQFARNVLNFLVEKRNPLPSPRDLADRIERNIGAFVLGILKKHDNDWWNQLVPVTMRQKCATRCEEEANRCPKEAYLDLIDLKNIMQKEWKHFETCFLSVGIKGGKEKSLAWMDRLNTLRRLVAHPIKLEVSGYQFSEEDRAFLTEWDQISLQMRRIARAA